MQHLNFADFLLLRRSPSCSKAFVKLSVSAVDVGNADYRQTGSRHIAGCVTGRVYWLTGADDLELIILDEGSLPVQYRLTFSRRDLLVRCFVPVHCRIDWTAIQLNSRNKSKHPPAGHEIWSKSRF